MKPKSLTYKFSKQCIDKSRELFKINHFLLANEVLNKYTESEFIEILKDPIWFDINYYESSYINFDFKRNSAYAIHCFLYSLFQTKHKYLDALVKYADGYVLHSAIRLCQDYRKNHLIKRGLKSKDFRIRRSVAKYCSFNQLNYLLNDSRKEVRLAAIKRLGINNVSDKLLKDQSKEIKLSAAIYSKNKKIICDILEKEDNKKTYSSINRTLKIVKFLDKKDLLYNLNLKNKSVVIQKLIEAKVQIDS